MKSGRGLVSFGTELTFHIEDVGYWGPHIIVGSTKRARRLNWSSASVSWASSWLPWTRQQRNRDESVSDLSRNWRLINPSRPG